MGARSWLRKLVSEARMDAGQSYWPVFAAGPTASGQMVNARVAENLSTVLACVSVISSAAASLPALVYRQTDAGRVEVKAHPIARLIQRPNAAQTWPDLVEWLCGQVLLFGNALLLIDHDAAGRVRALRPIPWGNVQPQLLPSGTLAFDVQQVTALWGGTGMSRRLLASEVFHLKDRSDDGLLGRSRISRASEVLGNALGLQEYVGSVWRNAAAPSGILKASGKMLQPQMDALREAFAARYMGSENARRPLVLTEGLDWKQVSVSPEDAEVLASRRFSVEELCRLFQVPPPLVQDYTHNTFTNASQAALWFAQFCLGPWIRKIEAEFSRSVFTDPSMQLELDLSGLMRGDYAARWQANVAAVQADILTTDEVREAEGWNPRGQGGASG